MHTSGEWHRVMIAADGPVDYQMDVDGDIELVTDQEIDANFAEASNDTKTSTDTGTRINGYTGAVTTSGFIGDTYDVNGPITRIEITTGEENNVRFFVDGSEVSGASEVVSGWRHGRDVLEVLGQGERVEYDMTVNGDVRRYQTAPHICAATTNDSVVKTGLSTVNGVTGGSFGDAYAINGDVEEFSASGPVTLRLNGSTVTPDELTGDVEDPNGGDGDPCDGVTCGEGEHCEDGQCVPDDSNGGDPDDGDDGEDGEDGADMRMLGVVMAGAALGLAATDGENDAR